MPRSVSHLDEKASRTVNQERKEMMGGDLVGINREAEYTKPLLEIV
jgi:hypothetical protein